MSETNPNNTYNVSLSVVDNGHNTKKHYVFWNVTRADAKALAIEEARMSGYESIRVIEVNLLNAPEGSH